MHSNVPWALGPHMHASEVNATAHSGRHRGVGAVPVAPGYLKPWLKLGELMAY